MSTNLPPHSPTVLVDADALVALAKQDDTNHKYARDIQQTLEKRGTLFYISPFTIPEVATVLSYKVDHDAAKKFLKTARDINFFELEFTAPLRDIADQWFLRQTKKGVAYFDCVNMALLKHFSLDAIFSFDAIYKMNGFITAEKFIA